VPARSPEIHPNPEVLKWARESSGWSVDEISSKLKLDTSTYRSFESGDKPIRLTTLEALGEYFKRPVAVFFLPSAPKEPAPPTDFRFLPTALRRFDKKTILAMRRAQRLQNVARDLLQRVGRPTEPRMGEARLDNDPEEVALEERKRFGIPLENQAQWRSAASAFEEWRAAIEDLNVLVFRFGMPVDNARGFSLSDATPFVIVVSSADAPAARIFTLMHEYAHLLLKTSGICIPQLTGTRQVNITHVEQWCNRFSAALLVPRELFSAKIDWKAMAEPGPQLSQFLSDASSRLRVSRQVVLRRMFDLQLIAKKTYNAEMQKLIASTKIPKGGGFTLPDRRCIFENGRLFTSIVLESRTRGIITTRDVSDYLSLPAKHLRSIQSLVAA